MNVDIVAAAHALAPQLKAFFDGLLDGKRPGRALADLGRFLEVAPAMSADEVLKLLAAETAPTGR